MSQEENLKRVDLKVSINCCCGCKRKVLKALSIKGVLKAEIHPTLPKITVTGDVDVQTLIRKLAKIGKKAELWPSHPESQVPDSVETKEEERKGHKKELHDYDHDQGKVESREDEDGHREDHHHIAPSANGTASSYQTVVTAIPVQVMNPNTMPPVHYSQVYYQMEPVHPVPMAYYTMNAASNSVPSPCCNQRHYGLPVYNHPPTVQSQQQPPMAFTDYFNDDNTAGCCVM